MGRTAKFDRQSAIDTCMQMVWRNGYESCSIKAISEALGITRSSFYNAFGSREALFLEVLDYYAAQAPDYVLNNVDKNVSVKCLLTDFFLDVCRNRTTDPERRGCLAVNCIAELVGVDETLGPVMEKALKDSLRRFEHLLTVAVKQGEIPDSSNQREQALALQNLLVGLNVMAKVIRSRSKLEAIVQQTLQGLGLYEIGE